MEQVDVVDKMGSLFKDKDHVNNSPSETANTYKRMAPEVMAAERPNVGGQGITPDTFTPEYRPKGSEYLDA